MRHECARCGIRLEFGDLVIQSIHGKNYGAITPAMAQVEAEWHKECFELEFTMQSQQRPYRCAKCSQKIHYGDEYLCIVIGLETSEDYTVAEHRGYELYNVEHRIACEKT